MLFSVQRFIEDYVGRRGIDLRDDYAVRLATLYVDKRRLTSREDFLQKMKKIPTAAYRNAGVKRAAFEEQLLTTLDGKFSKKKLKVPGDLVIKFQRGRRTFVRRGGSSSRVSRRPQKVFKVHSFVWLKASSNVEGRPGEFPCEEVPTAIELRQVIDLLASLFSDSDGAATAARRAGIPRSLVPHFTNALEFWTIVVEGAHNGMILDGVRPLLDEAKKVYPYHTDLDAICKKIVDDAQR